MGRCRHPPIEKTYKRELWRSGWPRAYPRTRPAVRGYGPVSLPRSSSSIRSFERELGPERGHRAPRGSLPVAPASCRRQSDASRAIDTAIASAVAPVRQRRPRSVSPAAPVRTQNAKHKNLPRDLPWIEYFRRGNAWLAPVSPFSSIKQSRYLIEGWACTWSTSIAVERAFTQKHNPRTQDAHFHSQTRSPADLKSLINTKCLDYDIVLPPKLMCTTG